MAAMSLQARRDFLQMMIPKYREASTVKEKSKLLDAFTATTGYNRTYAKSLLNHAEEVQQTLRRSCPRQYGPEVQHALFLVWKPANRICPNRLIPFLPTLIEAQECQELHHLKPKVSKATALQGRSDGRSPTVLSEQTGAARSSGVL